MSTKRCGYTLVDPDGEQYPCDRPARSWRWYQDVEHEDALDEACELHENEGGRRLHAAESKVRAVEALEEIYRRPVQPGAKYIGIAYKNVADDLRAALAEAENI